MLTRTSNRNIAAQQTSDSTTLPAPTGGMDARIGVASDNMDVCLWAINILPVEYGMRVRNGYRVWQEGMPSEVRTIIPYEGSVTTGTDNRIFSVCAEGIYDTSTQAGTPVQKLAFSDTGENAGWGVFTHYIDASGDDIVYYADGANGLFIYTPATDAWAQATGITPAAGSLGTFNIADIVYIVSHKLRLWFITKDSNKAWYLPVASFQGEATEFFFGAKFKHGGNLVGLFNWTVDGGSGRDDHLVAVSRSGDVLPYTGDDPSSDMTWENTGVFFIGQVPRGNRIASEYGGELFLLSTYGITPLSDLLRGAEVSNPNRARVGDKVARLMRIDMRNYVADHGWNVKFIADEGVIVVNTPLREDGGYRQYVYNATTAAWGLWRDVPYVCGESYEGDVLVGDPSGRLLRMDVPIDNLPAEGGMGEDIRWFVLTSFTTAGEPAKNKRVKLIRPNFSIEDSAPTYETYALYDYLSLEPAMPIAGPTVSVGSLWDTALWDVDNWSQSSLLPFFGTNGAWGMGHTFAIATTGRSRANTLLASWDVMWDVGGFL